MLRISTIALIASLVLSLGLAALESEKEESEPGTREFELVSVRLPDAMTVLRSIAGTRQLRPTGDRSLLVTDTPYRLEVAEKVIQMIDGLSPDESGFESFTLPAGNAVIATMRLRDVDARDAMDALRILRIARIAPCCADALMVIRDSPDQIEAARRLVQVLERVSAE